MMYYYNTKTFGDDNDIVVSCSSVSPSSTSSHSPFSMNLTGLVMSSDTSELLMLHGNHNVSLWKYSIKLPLSRITPEVPVSIESMIYSMYHHGMF